MKRAPPERDRLTALPGRRIFLGAVDRARALGRSLAVMVIDLDRFRQINDVFGHAAGDRVLREAAARIGCCVRDGDTVSRLGGDEFAVLLEGVASPSLASCVADSIRAELGRSFQIDEREACLSASIGIALCPRDGGSAEELLKRSDIAMWQAKNSGRDHHRFYCPGSETRISRKLEMEARLRRALKLGELELYYQPQASLADGAIKSVEALLRWNNPDLGWVSPAQFIPLAEETGLIHSIGAWVIETACAQARAWRMADRRPVKMCINVSAQQLNQGLIDTVSRVLARTGLSPAGLEFEITESVMGARDPDTEAALQSLRAMGIGFAIDDFGTGYSCFEYLKRLPVRTLKLAGCFVSGVCDNAEDAAIVAASVSLARNLGLRTVAEGVETAAQHERLRILGCDDGQGYHLCRPLPPAALDKRLGANSQAFQAERARLAIAG
jgi:diguanylate cyclase (GGDEF)-like protein